MRRRYFAERTIKVQFQEREKFANDVAFTTLKLPGGNSNLE